MRDHTGLTLISKRSWSAMGEARPRPVRCRWLFLLLGLLLTAAEALPAPPDQLYQQVLNDYRTLTKEPEKHRDRASWEKCIQGFQQVMRDDSRGELTPRCLFLIAQSYHHLYHFHKSTRDSREAINHYQLLLREFPNNTLADDAQYMLAVFHLDERHDQKAAYAELQRLVLHFPDSDMAPKARDKLAELERSGISKKAKGLERGKKTAEAANQPVDTGKQPATAGKKPAETGKKPSDSGKKPAQTAATHAKGKTTESPATAQSSVAKDPGQSAQGTAPAARQSPSTATRKPKGARAQSGTPTLAQQLGLGISRIVLDPGHGGKDGGAISPSGLREKDIVLNIAKTLKVVLERETGCQVLLTRTTDRYLSLEERTAFANAKKADVFISIHANANENRSVGGVETYFLNLASDPQAARVAALENASEHKRMSDLQSILKELVLKSKTSESSRLAHGVQNRIVTQLRERYKDVRDLGVKQAPFLVLVGAEMPSILVETAFLSNEQEELRLADQTFKDTLSRGIAGGVAAYMQQLTAEKPL
jgi:N-acetylmuramoyl-L-alanine amidase